MTDDAEGRGGQFASSALSLIPAFGPVLSIGLNLILSKEKERKAEEAKLKAIMDQTSGTMASNPYMANGGFLKQYNTGSHVSGNDLTINTYGNPDPNGGAVVQNDENMAYIKGTPFIFSDKLTNPLTGNKFNDDAKEIDKKYPNDTEGKQAKNFEFHILADSNMKEKQKYENGGFWDGLARTLNGLTVDKLDMENIFKPMGQQSDLSGDITPPVTSVSTPTDPASSPANSGDQPETGNNIYNGIALGLKGVSLLKSVADAIKPAEQEQTIHPAYQAADRMLADAVPDMTQAKESINMAYNSGMNQNRNGSGNFAAMMGRAAALQGNYANAMGTIEQQEANARAQVNMQRGQIENNRAIDAANRETQNRINNQQNQAVSDYADQKLFSELSTIGTEFNQYKMQQDEIKNNSKLQKFAVTEGLAILKAKYPNFRLDNNLMSKLESGETDAIVQFFKVLPEDVKTEIIKKGQ